MQRSTPPRTTDCRDQQNRWQGLAALRLHANSWYFIGVSNFEYLGGSDFLKEERQVYIIYQ